MNRRMIRSTMLLVLLALAALVGLSGQAQADAGMDGGVMLASSHGAMQHGQNSGTHMGGDDMPMTPGTHMDTGEMPMNQGEMPMDSGDMNMDDMNMDGAMDNAGQHMMQDGTMMDGQSHGTMMQDGTAPAGMMHDTKPSN